MFGLREDELEQIFQVLITLATIPTAKSRIIIFIKIHFIDNLYFAQG